MSKIFPEKVGSVILSVSMLGASLLSSTEALAQMGRPGQRAAVNRAIVQHQVAKRAFIAGAVANERRNQHRHYEDHHYRDNNDGSRLLIGAAVGAVAAAVIINANKE